VKIGIIGAGKVGISIGFVLKQKGMKVEAVSDLFEGPLSVARKYLGEGVHYTFDSAEVVAASDVIVIATQDRVIRDVAAAIAEKAKSLEGKLFFHTSGAHPASLLEPLGTKGARLGALHPLQTFPDIDSAIKVLPGTYIFIEGEENSIDTLRTIGRALGFDVVRIEGEHKVLYHLSAVFVCNLLCALLYAGEEIMDKIGIEFKPFLPIIKATLANIESKGPLMSLTGPIIRGDVETVLSHLEAMKDMELYAKAYRALSLVALQMAKERKALDEDAIEGLKQVLEERSLVKEIISAPT
jgi:predicted short-subunit dehydrogenase-like oxidoreductase (DUF2520 family)